MRILTTACGIGLLALAFAAPLKARTPQSPAERPVVLTEENLLIYQGWSALAAGQLNEARAKAEQVVQRYPRNIAAASLLVEVEIVRAGGLAGLSAYDAWMGDRKIDDGNLLRRVSRAILWDTTKFPENASDALQYLASDGDAEARAQLARRMLENGLGETRALARIGDEGAARRLIAQMEAFPGDKGLFIAAVIESKSPLAIPALIKILDDSNHPANVAAAADGLGTLNARIAIPQLQRLFNDPAQLPSIRFFAAGALYKLDDMTGVTYLQQRLTATYEDKLTASFTRLQAARVLATKPDGTWKTIVLELARDPDSSVRAQVLELLAPYDLDLARANAESLLHDDNPVVRQIAGKALVQRIAGDFGTLRRMLRSPDVPVQIAAAGRVLELTR